MEEEDEDNVEGGEETEEDEIHRKSYNKKNEKKVKESKRWLNLRDKETWWWSRTVIIT